MKLMTALKYLFLSISVFLAAPAAGQTNGCGKWKISAPDYLDPWDSRNFTVKTETGESVTADWTLVKENYRTKGVDVQTERSAKRMQ